MTESTQVMACTLDDEAVSDRKLFFQQRLLPGALHCRRKKNGLQIAFSKDPALKAKIRDFIALERECCNFLEFTLTEDIDNARLLLSVSGPAGAQRFLRQLESILDDSDIAE